LHSALVEAPATPDEAAMADLRVATEVK
jgi:hypothetical protein